MKKSYELKCAHEPAEAVRYLERNIILNAIDRLWQEHLYATDALRESVGLRRFAQKDPLVEYKTEAYDMFTEFDGQHQIRDRGTNLSSRFDRRTASNRFSAFLQNLPQFAIQRRRNGRAANPAKRSRASSRSSPESAESRSRALPEPHGAAEPSTWMKLSPPGGSRSRNRPRSDATIPARVAAEKNIRIAAVERPEYLPRNQK